MHAAPAVSVLCGHGAAWRWFGASVAALAAVALAAWGLGQLEFAVWPALWLAPLVAAMAWWLPQPLPANLSWDGQRWLLDDREGDLNLMIDLGPWLLLRWCPKRAGTRRRWLPFGAAAAGANLHALRVAVYCRPPKPAQGARPAENGMAKESV